MGSLGGRGEKLEIRELAPIVKADPAENALCALLSLSNRVAAIRNPNAMEPLSGHFIGPGRLVAIHRLRRWFAFDDTTNTWEVFGKYIDDQAGVIEEIRAALQKPHFVWTADYSRELNRSDSGQTFVIRSEMDLLNYAAMNELRRGRLAQSQRLLLDEVQMVARLSAERMTYRQQMREAFGRIAFYSVWAALEEPGWTEDQLAELQNAWMPMDFVGDMAKTLEMERMMRWSYFQHLQTTSTNLPRELEGYWDAEMSVYRGGAAEVCISGLRPLQPWLWRHIWGYQDIFRCMARNETFLEQSRAAFEYGMNVLAAAPQISQVEWVGLLPDGRTPKDFLNRVRYTFSYVSLGSRFHLIKAVLETQTEHQMVCGALACHRYRLSTGAWPERWDQLIPKFLASVPHDSLGGGNLIYRPDPVRGFLLYSKGDNGVDDGGDPTDGLKHHEEFRIGGGKDMVWPLPATVDQADEDFLAARSRNERLRKMWHR